MRRELFFVGDIIHVFNRGNRKQEIVRDNKDRMNFLLALYYLNNEKSPSKPLSRVRELLNLRSNLRLVVESGNIQDGFFIWPPGWEPREPLVKIMAFVLLGNHYHLILKEIKEGGVSKFMRKLGNSITGSFNEKYKETGKLFQGSYKAKCIKEDNQLKYLAVYIMVKNTFEMYPGGIKNALKNFDDAYDFAVKYSYGSLSSYSSDKVLPVIDKDILENAFENPEDFKEFARNCIEFVYYSDGSNSVICGNNEN
jgi:putative transposase